MEELQGWARTYDALLTYKCDADNLTEDEREASCARLQENVHNLAIELMLQHKLSGHYPWFKQNFHYLNLMQSQDLDCTICKDLNCAHRMLVDMDVDVDAGDADEIAADWVAPTQDWHLLAPVYKH